MRVRHARIPSMKINILTIFPNYFSSPLNTSIIARAIKQKHIQVNVINIRDFAKDKHQTTDDRPFGGGPGMVMKIEPIHLALEANKLVKGKKDSKIVLTSAKGKLFNQEMARDYSTLDELTIICGHYEGVDERVANYLVDEEVRIGNYVLTGGEPASLVITDAVIRLLPNVLGNSKSNQDESHQVAGQLGFSQYTKPRVYNTWQVPEVLLNGNHQEIKKYRQEQKEITCLKKMARINW